MSTDFLVIPGQVIAVSETDDEESSLLLRGHGTYIEHRRGGNRPGGNNNSTSSSSMVLRAAIPGTVQRVNQLVSVLPVSLSRPPQLQVGDLVVGRITNIVNARWTVDLGSGGLTCDLPLSGIHLTTTATTTGTASSSSSSVLLSGLTSGQRIRTAADALEMRQVLREGDLVSAEVHKVVPALQLHTRSAWYGKLENGGCVMVPAALIPRLKQHYITMGQRSQFQVLLGCNGWIWFQRNHHYATSMASSSPGGGTNHPNNSHHAEDVAETQQERRRTHAGTPYTLEDRRDLARLRNSILCLKEIIMEITPEAIEQVYRNSEQDDSLAIADMLLPENIVTLTASLRK